MIDNLTCAGCGAFFTHTAGGGRKPKRCPECTRKHRGAVEVAKYHALSPEQRTTRNKMVREANTRYKQQNHE